MNSESLFPPMPVPPFHRPVARTVHQTVTGDTVISLSGEVTYLNNTTSKTGGAPYEVTLPNGSYVGQMHQFFIPKSNALSTARFVVIGSFAHFTALLFNTRSHSAVLTWDGSGWNVVGGNADDYTDEVIGDIEVPGETAEGTTVRVKGGKLQLKVGDLWYDLQGVNAGGVLALDLSGEGEQ